MVRVLVPVSQLKAVLCSLVGSVSRSAATWAPIAAVLPATAPSVARSATSSSVSAASTFVFETYVPAVTLSIASAS